MTGNSLGARQSAWAGPEARPRPRFIDPMASAKCQDDGWPWYTKVKGKEVVAIGFETQRGGEEGDGEWEGR